MSQGHRHSVSGQSCICYLWTVVHPPDLTECTGSSRLHAQHSHSSDSAAPSLTFLAGGQPTGFLDDGIRIERLQVGSRRGEEARGRG